MENPTQTETTMEPAPNKSTTLVCPKCPQAEKWTCLLHPAIHHRLNLYWSELDQKHKGFVELINVMPTFVPNGRTGDAAIVQAARVSYGSTSLKGVKADAGLINYLVEHYHTSPIEMGEVQFICSCPLFVFNQLVRHRTANINCISRRYTAISGEDFYVPEMRLQDDLNKQGSVVPDEKNAQVLDGYFRLFDKARGLHSEYEDLVTQGVAREVARAAMPQNVMTTFVWKSDLHNFLKMVRLRVHHTAQKEIRDLAEAMYQLVKPIFPLTCEAFEKHWLNKVSFSSDEVAILKQGKQSDGSWSTLGSKRKDAEFLKKISRIGL